MSIHWKLRTHRNLHKLKYFKQFSLNPFDLMGNRISVGSIGSNMLAIEMFAALNIGLFVVLDIEMFQLCN